MSDWNFVAGNSVVNRHVKSLYEVAVAFGIEESVRYQLREIKNFISNVKNYQKFLQRVSLIAVDGRSFVEDLKKDLKLSKEVGNFLALLLKNGRFSLIVEICDNYEFFVDKIRGKKIFYVTYAKEFSKSDEKRLIKNLSSTFDGNIECIAKKDASLLDGIKVQYRSKILDYSVKSRLRRLHSAIRGDNYEN